jgi:MFS family permease
MMDHTESTYRWYILALATLTNALGIAMPTMAVPVLFAEISRDLNLDLVQVGVIWGIGSLSGIAATLIGGAVGDRFGAKRVLIAVCVLAGAAGAARGLSDSYLALAVSMFLFGLFPPMIPMNAIKICRTWFPRRQLGLANGVLSMGMALGFMLGSALSATTFSPLLGGWRHVLLVYGVLVIILAVPWYFTRTAPAAALPEGETARRSLLQTLGLVSRIRRLWLLGLAIFGIGGCIQGALGYLPLYLRDAGWPVAQADGALSVFHLASMICVIPIALYSDRIGSRKKVLIPATLMVIAGFSLLSQVTDGTVWLAVILAGFVRDGFMAVFITMILETDGIGPAYAGTAVGFVMVFSNLGNLAAPPLGNSLAASGAGLPFIFWSGMAVVGMVGILLARERSAARERVAEAVR